MGRIKLAFPEPVLFTTELSIQISDINYGGHVGNDRYLTLLQEVRYRWFQHMKYDNEMSLGENTGIIVADAAVQYMAEMFYGDVLTADLSVGDVTHLGMDIFYRLTRASDSKVCCIAKTGVVCFNYETRKMTPMPESFKDKLRSG